MRMPRGYSFDRSSSGSLAMLAAMRQQNQRGRQYGGLDLLNCNAASGQLALRRRLTSQ